MEAIATVDRAINSTRTHLFHRYPFLFLFCGGFFSIEKLNLIMCVLEIMEDLVSRKPFYYLSDIVNIWLVLGILTVKHVKILVV